MIAVPFFVPVVTLLAFAAPLTAVAQAQTLLDGVLAGSPCEARIRHQLAEWHAKPGRAMVDPAEPTGARSLRLATGALGLWVRVVETPGRGVAVEHISATRTERLDFDDACHGNRSAVAMSPAPPGAYADSDLIARISRGDRGVFLLWSPHMPLSVDQHAVLAEVARELGLAVVPLLDPLADPAYAAAVVRERGLPGDATRPLGGIELAFRGMTTHTPSLQAFAGGQLVGPVRYGYRNAEVLAATLRETFGVR